MPRCAMPLLVAEIMIRAAIIAATFAALRRVERRLMLYAD